MQNSNFLRFSIHSCAPVFDPPHRKPKSRGIFGGFGDQTFFLVWWLQRYSKIVRMDFGKFSKKQEFQKNGHLTLDAAIWAGFISNVRVKRGLLINYVQGAMHPILKVRSFLSSPSSEPLGRGKKLSPVRHFPRPNGKSSFFHLVLTRFYL